MYHRLHNTSCWLSKTTAIYWSKKPLWRVYGSRSKMQTVQALAWTTNRNSNDEILIFHRRSQPKDNVLRLRSNLLKRIDHSLRRNYMMKMSANNMNEPIVRWRERGVAFFMLSYHFFPCCHFTFFMLDTVHWKEYIKSLETKFYKFLSIS